MTGFLTGQWLTCARCKTSFAIADELYIAAKASEKINFFCPYGHSNYFPAGESEETKLRRERDRLQQQLAQKDDEIETQRKLADGYIRKLSAARGQITKVKRRIGHGICPCCSRTFENLARHMATKHADYQKEEAHG